MEYRNDARISRGFLAAHTSEIEGGIYLQQGQDVPLTAPSIPCCPS